MHKLLAAIVKETKLILRDKEALLILLAMPAVFVLIMSLALRDSFNEKAGVQFSVLIVDQDGGHVSVALTKVFSANKHFKLEQRRVAAGDALAPAAFTQEVVGGKFKFVLWIPARASASATARVQAQLSAREPDMAPVAIELFADPTLRRDHRSFVLALVNGALRELEAELFIQKLTSAAPASARIPIFKTVHDRYDAAGASTELPIPTSVQQNAPAWALLAMFFVAIPLSVTFIKEAQQGSLLRLRTMPVAPAVFIGGKVVPYFLVNQLQILLVLLEGKYLLPLFGGDALQWGDSPGGLALVSIAANLAAIGYGFLIAVFARSQEQATTFGAISVLILAAIGGIMVPKLVMPPLMQRLAELSPLSWGLDGFLDVFIRGGHIAAVLPEVFRLLAFALVCFAIAGFRLQKHTLH